MTGVSSVFCKVVVLLQYKQLQHVKDFLLNDKRGHVTEETKERLSFLNSGGARGSNGGNGIGVKPQLSAIQEINSTGKIYVWIEV